MLCGGGVIVLRLARDGVADRRCRWRGSRKGCGSHMADIAFLGVGEKEGCGGDYKAHQQACDTRNEYLKNLNLKAIFDTGLIKQVNVR